MKQHNWMAVSLVAVALGAAPSVRADIIVDVYTGHSSAGGGAPYSGYVGTLHDTDVLFGTETAFAWHPFGLGAFGADITGGLDVAASGNYTFSLRSDDGSLFFIDGSLVVNNGGAHGPATVSGSVALTAGSHSFEVQFYEDFGGPSGVDLYLPAGVQYSTPDAGSSLALLGGAFAALGALGRKSRK